MEKIIESKQQIPEVRPRIEDTPDPKTLDLEEKYEKLEKEHQDVVNQLGDALFKLGKANKRISDFELSACLPLKVDQDEYSAAAKKNGNYLNIVLFKNGEPFKATYVAADPTELEKKIEGFKEGVLREVIGHAKSLRNKQSLMSAFVTGQMNINGLSWSDIKKEFLEGKN